MYKGHCQGVKFSLCFLALRDSEGRAGGKWNEMSSYDVGFLGSHSPCYYRTFDFSNFLLRVCAGAISLAFFGFFSSYRPFLFLLIF